MTRIHSTATNQWPEMSATIIGDQPGAANIKQKSLTIIIFIDIDHQPHIHRDWPLQTHHYQSVTIINPWLTIICPSFTRHSVMINLREPMIPLTIDPPWPRCFAVLAPGQSETRGRLWPAMVMMLMKQWWICYMMINDSGQFILWYMIWLCDYQGL